MQCVCPENALLDGDPSGTNDKQNAATQERRLEELMKTIAFDVKL